jgi:lysophospholipase L1-like esterase
MRALVQRLLLVGLGIALGLGLLEGALQLAALVLPSHLKRAMTKAERSAQPGEVSILCIGDSHTYGVGVTADEAYPVQLERILRDRGVRVHVVNDGIPGRDSGRLRADLRASLAQYRPQVVLVWVGANNQWMPIDPDAPRARLALRDRLRLVRLLRLLRSRIEGVSGDFRPQFAYVFALDDEAPRQGRRAARQRRSVEATAEVMRGDLGPIIEDIRDAGAVPVLLTYPFALGPMLQRINEVVIEAGARQDAEVIDLRVMARRHGPRARALLLPDMHPAPRLYRAIAWEIARTLVREDVIAEPAAAARSGVVGGTTRSEVSDVAGLLKYEEGDLNPLRTTD